MKKHLISLLVLLLLVSTTFIAGAFDDTLPDKDRESPQSNDTMIFRYAFIWGTYEHRIKDWLLSFQIWNDDWSNLTIHVIGYWIRESRYVHVEAYFVSALRHIGIIGPHQCCIFAFGLLTVGC